MHAKSRKAGAKPLRRVWAPERLSIRRAAARGFTLVEVIVALAVLAVVLVSVFRMQSGNLNAVERLAFNSRAAMLAQAKIADLDARGLDDDLDQQGDFGEDAPGYAWRITATARDDELLGETARRLFIIDIRIDLNQDEHVFDLRTQRLVSLQSP